MSGFPCLALLLILLSAGCNGGDAAATTPIGPSTIAIPDIQGTGDTSPYVGRNVTVVGVVTGDFQNEDPDTSSNLGGFFIQASKPDGIGATSEGLFVFDGGSPAIDVEVGNLVQVSGKVQEHFGETQLAAGSVAIVSADRYEVEATEIRLPFDSVTTNSNGEVIAGLEQYEGMLVGFPQTMTVSEVYNLERYGSLRLSEGGRLYQFTNRNAPGRSGYEAHKNSIASRSVELDDGRRDNNVTPIRYLAPHGNALRVGDTVTDATGNLRYSRGSGGNGKETWRLMPTTNPAFASANPRPGPPNIDGSLRIASFNVLNYFSGIDSGRDNCGPDGNNGCRGADSAQELQRQLEKTVTALAIIDADIVGLIELENNASKSLSDIVDALNARTGAGTWAHLDTGSIGDDAIKTGFIYKAGTVSPSGAFEILDEAVDPRFGADRNRPALAQTFSETSSGERLTVVVNHLKSKGSDCDADGDPNTGDGQGNCNRTRTRASEAMADWLATDPTGSGDSDFLVIGDLNAYLQEDPLAAFKEAGYTNLIESEASTAYSFVYDGQSGALDHALASDGLLPQVAEAIEWHINADESPVHDYNLEHGRDAAIFDGSQPYRASDHDPVVIGLNLR